jgi:hypothetical protein
MLVPAPGAVATRTVRAGLECAPYLIIGLRGSAQAMDDPLGMSGVTGTYAREALNKLPADRTKTYSLPYPAWGVTLKGFLSSVNEGRWILTIALRRLVRMCPGMNIGLIGYSQGAMVINQALPMLDAEERKAVRAVMMISDPQSAGDTVEGVQVRVRAQRRPVRHRRDRHRHLPPRRRLQGRSQGEPKTHNRDLG